MHDLDNILLFFGIISDVILAFAAQTFAAPEGEVKEEDHQKCGTDDAEVIEGGVLARGVGWIADIAHHGKVDEQDDWEHSGFLQLHFSVTGGDGGAMNWDSSGRNVPRVREL